MPWSRSRLLSMRARRRAGRKSFLRASIAPLNFKSPFTVSIRLPRSRARASIIPAFRRISRWRATRSAALSCRKQGNGWRKMRIASASSSVIRCGRKSVPAWIMNRGICDMSGCGNHLPNEDHIGGIFRAVGGRSFLSVWKYRHFASDREKNRFS